MEKLVKKDKKTKKTTWPNVYVLMRIYCPDLHAHETFLNKLHSTLQSVEENKKSYELMPKDKNIPGRVCFLFNDDTIKGDSDELYNTYRTLLKNKLNTFFKKDWKETYNSTEEKDKEKEVYKESVDKEPGGKGSSYSTYLVRELFINEAKGDDDIAISLDQDDILRPGALKNIARSMCRGGIVVSPFRIIDPSHLDITDDGGRIHNRLVRKLVCSRASSRIVNGKEALPEKKYEKLYIPFGKSERKDLRNVFEGNWELLCERIKCRYKNIMAGKHSITELSSLGWTKSYTKKVLNIYMSDLKELLGGNEKDAQKKEERVRSFFNDHRAYEDFIDFYPLLFESVTVTGVREATHDYVKNPASITSSPTVEDFRDHRTATLIALIDLCYAREHAIKDHNVQYQYARLCANYKIKLHRFVASKVYQIEAIINQYNERFVKGERQFADFDAKTHRGYFMSKLARLALGERRLGLKQDDDLFHYDTSRRGDASRENFSDLFSEKVFNSVPYYGEIISSSSPRFVLRRSVFHEKTMRRVGRKEQGDTEKSPLTSGGTTPNQKRLRFLYWGCFVCCVIFAICIGLLIWKLPWVADHREITEKIIRRGNKYLVSLKDYQQILAAFVALTGVIATIIANEIGKVKILAADEEATVKLYYSEFQDFIRHLEQNLKVLIQIRKEIKVGKFNVESIHFDNLKWPTTSILFSDEMAKLIARDRVDDFARLKVNIRNINNSASWLQQAAQNHNELLKAIEWEIPRYFGYLINMYYLESNEFCFPSADQLDQFIHKNSFKNRLTRLFMDYEAKDRLEEVDSFIDHYLDDRRMKRSVLVEPTNNENENES